ncbi:hypothetical protein HDU99_001587 [Rhizoclosmatium hyalinum]|nr:hypothetical protein HDU99_001587 [Rhizoclosmatium hyalinum]
MGPKAPPPPPPPSKTPKTDTEFEWPPEPEVVHGHRYGHAQFSDDEDTILAVPCVHSAYLSTNSTMETTDTTDTTETTEQEGDALEAGAEASHTKISISEDIELERLKERSERRKENKLRRKEHKIMKRLDLIVSPSLSGTDAPRGKQLHSSHATSIKHRLEVPLHDMIQRSKSHSKHVNAYQHKPRHGSGSSSGRGDASCSLEQRQKALNTYGGTESSNSKAKRSSSSSVAPSSWVSKVSPASISTTSTSAKKPSFKAPPEFTQESTKVKAGDWICNSCEYVNFRYRLDCNHCGTGKFTSIRQDDYVEERDENEMTLEEYEEAYDISDNESTAAPSSTTTTATSTATIKPTKPNNAPQTSYFDIIRAANEKLLNLDISQDENHHIPKNTTTILPNNKLKPLLITEDHFPSLSTTTITSTTTKPKPPVSYAGIAKDESAETAAKLASAHPHSHPRHPAQPTVTIPAVVLELDEWSSWNTAAHPKPKARKTGAGSTTKREKWTSLDGANEDGEDDETEKKKRGGNSGGGGGASRAVTEKRGKRGSSSGGGGAGGATSKKWEEFFPAPASLVDPPLGHRDGAVQTKVLVRNYTGTPNTGGSNTSQTTLVDDDGEGFGPVDIAATDAIRADSKQETLCAELLERGTTTTAAVDPDNELDFEALLVASSGGVFNAGDGKYEWGMSTPPKGRVGESNIEAESVVMEQSVVGGGGGAGEEGEEEVMEFSSACYGEEYAMDADEDVKPVKRHNGSRRGSRFKEWLLRGNGEGVVVDDGDDGRVVVNCRGEQEKEFEKQEEEEEQVEIQVEQFEVLPGKPLESRSVMPTFTVPAVELPYDEWADAPVAVDPVPVPTFVRTVKSVYVPASSVPEKMKGNKKRYPR